MKTITKTGDINPAWADSYNEVLAEGIHNADPVALRMILDAVYDDIREACSELARFETLQQEWTGGDDAGDIAADTARLKAWLDLN